MKPSDISKDLRRIASLIENSKNPAKDLVIRDIKSVIKKIASNGLDVTVTMTQSDNKLTVHTLFVEPIVSLTDIDFDSGMRPRMLSNLSRKSLEAATQSVIGKFEELSNNSSDMKCLYDDAALKGDDISHVCECISTFDDSRDLSTLKDLMRDSLTVLGYHGAKVL